MKKTFHNTLLILIPVLIFVSCRQATSDLDYLSQAEALSMFSPDEALLKLDSIKNLEQLDADSYMRYILTRTEAKFRQEQDITNDTLIFRVKEYFNKNKDILKNAKANFYTGLIYYFNDEIDKALENFITAKELALQTNDTLLIGRSYNNIAYMYYEVDIFDSAIINYEKALKYYYKCDNNAEFILPALRYIGDSHRESKNYQQAESYFKKGLEVYNETNIEYFDVYFKHYLGALYTSMNRNEEAYYLIKEIIPLTDNATDSLVAYMNLAQIFTNVNKLDSADYYINLTHKRLNDIKDKYSIRYTVHNLSCYYKRQKDYKKALYYSEIEKEATRLIEEEREAQKIYAVNLKRHVENKQKELEAAQKHHTQIFACILVVLLIIIAAAIYGFITIRKHFDVRMKSIKAMRLHYEHRVRHLMQLQNSYSDMIEGIMDVENELILLEIGGHSPTEKSTRARIFTKNLHNKTNEQLIKWAKDFLKIQPFGEKISAQLHDDGILFLTLCAYGYSDEEIAIIAEMPEEDVKPLKMEMKKMLEQQGLNEKDIEDMISGEDIFSSL